MTGSMQKDEVACVYAALALQDDGVEVTEQKLGALLKAAKVDVDPLWPKLFSKALQGVDVAGLITSVSSGIGGAGGGGAAVAQSGSSEAAPAAAAEAKKEEAKKEESESDEDMGFGLFD